MIAFQCMPRILKLVVMRLPHSPCSLKLLAVWVLLLSVDQYLNALVIVYTIHAVSLAQMANSRENTERYKTDELPIIPHLAHNCKVWRLICFSTSDCFDTVLRTHIYGTNFGSSFTVYFIRYILTLWCAGLMNYLIWNMSWYADTSFWHRYSGEDYIQGIKDSYSWTASYNHRHRSHKS